MNDRDLPLHLEPNEQIKNTDHILPYTEEEWNDSAQNDSWLWTFDKLRKQKTQKVLLVRRRFCLGQIALKDVMELLLWMNEIIVSHDIFLVDE